MSLGGTPYLCGPSSFFLSSIDVPIESQIVEASEDVPLLSMLLGLDMSIVREILNREELPAAETSGQQRGVAIGQAPAGLLNACSRLMELLDSPEDIPFLSHLIQREIIYRILKTPQGARLRTIATTGTLATGQPERSPGSKTTMGSGCTWRSWQGCTNGSFNPSSSVPRIDRDEPASIPKAVEAAESKGADAYGRGGRHERSLRGRLRKRQPIQPGIQPLLWPATHARRQSSSSEQYCRRIILRGLTRL